MKRKLKLSRIGLFLIILVILCFSSPFFVMAQNNAISSYALDNGFGVSMSPSNTKVWSAVGQSSVGDMRQANTVVGTGFMANGSIFVVTSAHDIGHKLPLSYTLYQNYPNPFNPSTTFRYEIPRRSKVQICIYNVLGQKVATVLDEEKEAGYYTIVWNGRKEDGSQLCSGVYFYRIQTEQFVQTKKFVLLR